MRLRSRSISRQRGLLRRPRPDGNAPARRVVIDIPHSNQAAEALIVLDDHRLFQAVYVGPRGTQSTEEAKRFLSSFALER